MPVPIVSTGIFSAAENLDAGTMKHQNAFEGSFRVTAFFHQKLFRLKLVIASLWYFFIHLAASST